MPRNIQAQEYITVLNTKGFHVTTQPKQGRGEEIYQISKPAWAGKLAFTFTQTYTGLLKFTLVLHDGSVTYKFYRAITHTGLLNRFNVTQDYHRYTTTSKALNPSELLVVAQILHYLAFKNTSQLNLYLQLLPKRTQ